jgi:dihydroorotate dehydrogenase
MYKYIFKPLLFKLDAEKAHQVVFLLLSFITKIPGVSAIIYFMYTINDKRLERELFGLRFKNPVGMAAGFDKNAKLFNEFSYFGFGFVEIGTVTPLPQEGNEKPRLFRLPKDKALINRMGFNNDGASIIAQRLKRRRTSVIVGGNIGKNKNTPIENAGDDYEKCFSELFDCVHYFAVNVSSPNTPGLRSLQEKGPLTDILLRLQKLNQQKNNPKPILLKIAPDLTNEQLDEIIEIVLATKISGVIATNTTISRTGLTTNSQQVEAIGMGGLSGLPLNKRATEVIAYIAKKTNKAFPIIGVGGIHSADDALEKINAGADLVQLYSGYVYEGPSLVKKINKKILEKWTQ